MEKRSTPPPADRQALQARRFPHASQDSSAASEFDADPGLDARAEHGLNLDEDSTFRVVEPVVGLCNGIIRDAISLRGSDIHIEPWAKEVCVRIRVDGVLREHSRIPRWLHAELVSRVKVLAVLDIAKKRVPQDGRFTATLGERRWDIRVSTLPTHWGEKVVLRLLGATALPTFETLGLSAPGVSLLNDAIAQPQGMILVTGPTGHGKSTTLYSLLARRLSVGVNIVAIEDPIEYRIPGINQVQVDERSGLTFARCLRAVLRQDPDVILVGEIRDHETAEVAIQAALTGHLVLSTLHTNSAAATIDRLLDLGVRPLLVTAAVNLVIAQRLVRRICGNCRIVYTPPDAALRRLQIDPSGEYYHGAGCAACGETGYSGRVGIFEMLRLTPALKDLVRREASEPEIVAAAGAAGTRFLLEDAAHQVRAGVTTVEEVVRVMRFEHAEGPFEEAVQGERTRALPE
jgi:type II secretory ATPase GspE/PulE/Tfp pilus assembly ATPase PilB-like protein